MNEKKNIEIQFYEVSQFIIKAKENAYRNINTELIKLYWQIGKYISKKSSNSEWGDSVVDKLSEFIQNKHPEMKGFGRRGLYRMKQFYDTYMRNEKVSSLLTQITWTNHLIILSKAKSIEEKEFYILLASKEKYASRELERQFKSGYYERFMLSNKIVSAVPTQINKKIFSKFKDTYVMEFLQLPDIYEEKDLQKSIIRNMKKFILEFGRDFTFVGEEYRVQVGNSDYYIDLLFYHRELQCLVAVELKTIDFQPEHIGKMNFYLEALDRKYKKSYENPSVGIIICKGKDDEVVEFALSRNISPTMIAKYETKLIDKKALEYKLHELYKSVSLLD